MRGSGQRRDPAHDSTAAGTAVWRTIMRGAGERLTRACDTLPTRAPWSGAHPARSHDEQIDVELGRDLRRCSSATGPWSDVRRGVHTGCTGALHGGIGDVLGAVDLLDLGHRRTWRRRARAHAADARQAPGASRPSAARARSRHPAASAADSLPSVATMMFFTTSSSRCPAFKAGACKHAPGALRCHRGGHRKPCAAFPKPRGR